MSLALVNPTAALADDVLRCKDRLIERGMSQEEVLRYCGEPQERRTEERPIRSGNRVTGSVTAEIWRYDRYGQFPVELEFESEELKSLTYLER